jgi:hypothetical protein
VVEVAGGGGDYFEEIVFVASGVVDLEDSLELHDFFEEVGPAGGAVEDYRDVGGEGVANLFGVQACGIAKDHAALLKTVDTVCGGWWGVADELCEFSPGGAGVFDQCSQKFRI